MSLSYKNTFESYLECRIPSRNKEAFYRVTIESAYDPSTDSQTHEIYYSFGRIGTNKIPKLLATCNDMHEALRRAEEQVAKKTCSKKDVYDEVSRVAKHDEFLKGVKASRIRKEQQTAKNKKAKVIQQSVEKIGDFPLIVINTSGKQFDLGYSENGRLVSLTKIDKENYGQLALFDVLKVTLVNRAIEVIEIIGSMMNDEIEVPKPNISLDGLAR